MNMSEYDGGEDEEEEEEGYLNTGLPKGKESSSLFVSGLVT